MSLQQVDIYSIVLIFTYISNMDARRGVVCAGARPLHHWTMNFFFVYIVGHFSTLLCCWGAFFLEGGGGGCAFLLLFSSYGEPFSPCGGLFCPYGGLFGFAHPPTKFSASAHDQ